jgi:predicted nucleic acid-binding protein
MIVLAESNFVLEIALRQEQFEHAERILRLAEDEQLRLVIPACAIIEPYQTLIRRRRERTELGRRLDNEIMLLRRSTLHDEMIAVPERVAATLVMGTELEMNCLEQTIERLTRICLVPALSREIVRLAQIMQLEYELGPHDAIVLASIETVLQTLGAGPKTFVNKNFKDFDTPQIGSQLKKHECRLIASFPHACRYIENELKKSPAQAGRPVGNA